MTFHRVRSGAVGSGIVLQAGRSWIRFPMVSLEFFIDIILPAALGLTQPLTEMMRERRPVRRADNLTTFMCRLSWNLGASNSWNPQGLSRPLMGLYYLALHDVSQHLVTYLKTFSHEPIPLLSLGKYGLRLLLPGLIATSRYPQPYTSAFQLHVCFLRILTRQTFIFNFPFAKSKLLNYSVPHEFI
jgi:hypothetical protein